MQPEGVHKSIPSVVNNENYLSPVAHAQRILNTYKPVNNNDSQIESEKSQLSTTVTGRH